MVKAVDNQATNPELPEPRPPELKPLTVTVAMACKLTGLGNTTIWALIRDGKLETARVGRRTLIIFRSLEALVSPSSEASQQPRRLKRGRPRKVVAGSSS